MQKFTDYQNKILINMTPGKWYSPEYIDKGVKGNTLQSLVDSGALKVNINPTIGTLYKKRGSIFRLIVAVWNFWKEWKSDKNGIS